jgi:biotin synthase
LPGDHQLVVDRQDRSVVTLQRRNLALPVDRAKLCRKLLPLAKIDDIEFVRTVAVARITMPRSMVRLSAGRESMSESTQALCFLAGANSIFTGDKLLTTGNAGAGADAALFEKLGLKALKGEEPMRACAKVEAAE